MRYARVLLLIILFGPLGTISGEDRIADSNRLTTVEIVGSPFVPVLSSIHWVRDVDLLASRVGHDRFQLGIWALSDTWYLLPWPYSFFELGFHLSYFPIRRQNTSLRYGLGTAVEFVGLDISVPLYMCFEWRQRIVHDFWAGAHIEGFGWPNGVGIELTAPLIYKPDSWPYASLRPGIIAYLVDRTLNINYKLGLQLGLQRSK